MNAGKGWAQQIHFGPLRNVNSRAARDLGPDTGFDTIGDFSGAEAMASLLDRLDRDGKLAKTILYNLNPSDNVWVAAMIANFQDGSCRARFRWGPDGGSTTRSKAWRTRWTHCRLRAF